MYFFKSLKCHIYEFVLFRRHPAEEQNATSPSYKYSSNLTEECSYGSLTWPMEKIQRLIYYKRPSKNPSNNIYWAGLGQYFTTSLLAHHLAPLLKMCWYLIFTFEDQARIPWQEKNCHSTSYVHILLYKRDFIYTLISICLKMYWPIMSLVLRKIKI